MKRIAIAIMLLMCSALFCSCGVTAQNVNKPEKDVSIIIPDNDNGNVNGYKTESTALDNSSAEKTVSGVYYANSSSRKFHTSDCRYAKTINENNLVIVSDRQKLIDDGYVPAKCCNP